MIKTIERLIWQRTTENSGVTSPWVDDPCWIYRGSSTIRIGNGRWMKVVRWLYQHLFGPIEDDKNHVCHRCDCGNCVNPGHWFLGTQKDNMDDMYAKQRQNPAIGNRNGTHTCPEKLARGDAHYSRTNPEKLARGDRNGSRLHPESRPRGDAHFSHINPEKMARGEKVYGAKLTEMNVFFIRMWAERGFSRRKIAFAYKISSCQVGRIVRRQTWRHVA